MKPEYYLTAEELARLDEIQSLGREKVARHGALIKKMKSKSPGLTDHEKVELRALSGEVSSLEKERKALLDKNPLLPENVIKAFAAADAKRK